MKNGFTFEEGFPYTILDTGSSHLFVPAEFYERIIQNIMDEAGGVQFVIQDGVTLCECSNNFKPIWFMFSNHWIQINPEEYVFDVSDLKNGEICHI
jgi:hypothetical protein